MTKHLTLIAFIIASLQVLAIDTKVPELHWTLPTTLEGIRQERANLKIEEEPMPVSIMCQGRGARFLCTEQGVQVDVNKPERYWTVKRDMTLASAPYIALGIALHAVKRDVRKVNNDINDGFNNKVDDYLQYAPLALTYGLKATGYQGRSQWGRLLVSNAFSMMPFSSVSTRKSGWMVCMRSAVLAPMEPPGRGLSFSISRCSSSACA